MHRHDVDGRVGGRRRARRRRPVVSLPPVGPGHSIGPDPTGLHPGTRSSHQTSVRFIQLRSLPMVGCRAARRRLSDYLEDELAEDERRFVRLHLARCSPCRSVLRTLQAVVDSLGQLPADPLAGSIADAVERRLTPGA
jgi:hypothetical protein